MADLLGGLGTGTSVLGEVTKAFGQLQTGRDIKLVEQLNAAVSRANSEAIRTAGGFDIRGKEKAKKRFRGHQVAGYSKAGIRLEGSPIEVMIDSAAEAEIDILISKYNTNVAGIQADLQGKMSEISAKDAKQQAKYNMTRSLLSTIGSVAGMFGSFSTTPKATTATANRTYSLTANNPFSGPFATIGGR